MEVITQQSGQEVKSQSVNIQAYKQYPNTVSCWQNIGLLQVHGGQYRMRRT